ncbi:MAG TPA: YbaK/EbsC family protein, partial [Thermogutta sp.]|nr:YbaK/EbsC family protein [Thermogutta sp.]
GDETSNRMQPLELVATPGASTIEQVSRFLQCRPQDLIKTLIYLADGQPVAVLIRGDHEANENKIRRAFQAKEIVLADPKTIERVTGAPVGFAGPIGLKENIPIIADYDIQYVRNGVTGANQADAHYRGVNLGRDFQVTRFADLRCAVDNDPCPRCSGILRLRPAIEIGHVFKLGVKYSEALNARFLDADEQLKPIIMGCYGIGVNRILAALIETTHDENGIVWPVALAPYEVVIVPVNVTDEQTRQVATALHDELSKEEIDVILDDRDVRAGVKFKDADLIGFPLRIVVGERGLAQNSVEVKWRWDKNSQMLPLDSVVREVAQWIREERKTGQRFKSAVYGNRSGSPTR